MCLRCIMNPPDDSGYFVGKRKDKREQKGQCYTNPIESGAE